VVLFQLRPLALDPLSRLVHPAANNRVTTPQDLLLDLKVVIRLGDLLLPCPVISLLDLLVVAHNQVTHLVDPLPDDPPDFDLLVEDLKQVIHLVDQPLDLNYIIHRVDLPLDLKQVIQTVDLPLDLKQVIQTVDLPLDLKQVIQTVDLPLDLKQVIQTVDLLLDLKQVILTVDLLLDLKQVIRPVDLPLDLKQVIQTVDHLLDLKQVIHPLHPPSDNPVAYPLDLLVVVSKEATLLLHPLLRGQVDFLQDLLVGELKVTNQVDLLVVVRVEVLNRTISMVDLLQVFLPHHLADLQGAYNKLMGPPLVNTQPGLWEVEPHLVSLVVGLKDQDVFRVKLWVAPVGLQEEQVLSLVAMVAQRKGHMMKAIILLFLVNLAWTTPSTPRSP